MMCDEAFLFVLRAILAVSALLHDIHIARVVCACSTECNPSAAKLFGLQLTLNRGILKERFVVGAE